MEYTIGNGLLAVTVSDMGAEIISVKYKGEERSWQNRNGKWAGHSPVLFPVCGNSAVVIDGNDRKMPFHGLARRSLFTVVDKTPESVTMRYRFDETTLEAYPFMFEYDIVYTVDENAVIIKNTVRNLGGSVMPFAIGRHDSFELKGPLSGYVLRFDEEQDLSSQKHNEKGQLTGEFVDMGKGRSLALPEDFLVNGNTAIFGNVNGESLLLQTKTGEKVVELCFGEVNNLLLWRPDGAEMICLELWSALPDNQAEKIDFLKNGKYFTLDGGKEKTLDIVIRYY